jgi:hypothetical protein
LKIILKPLKSKKQFNELHKVKPLKASFDETGTLYTTTYRISDGRLVDVMIDFNTRQPKLLVSNFYTDSEV